jgi:DNA-binding CsgD family transcriptional regulator
MYTPQYLLGDFVIALLSTSSFQERLNRYVNFIETLGFEGRVVYTYLPLFSMESDGKLFPATPEFIYTPDYPLDFLQHYVAEGLDRYDISIKKIKNNDFSLTNYGEHAEKIGLKPDENYFDKLATQLYGCVNALNIPAAGAAGISAINIISREQPDIFNHLMRERSELLLQITRVFHSLVLSDHQTCTRFTFPFLPSLNGTEITILRYAASGKPLKNIQDHTGISYRYASNVLDKLRDKLGGISRDRLLYLVGFLRL